MSRTRIIYSPDGKKIAEYKNGDLVWSADEFHQPAATHMVMGDISPYQSMIDGSIITSRSRHREHLRDHGCIEVGNEKKYLMRNANKPIEPPPGLKDSLIRVFNQKVRS